MEIPVSSDYDFDFTRDREEIFFRIFKKNNHQETVARCPDLTSVALFMRGMAAQDQVVELKGRIEQLSAELEAEKADKQLSFLS